MLGVQSYQSDSHNLNQTHSLIYAFWKKKGGKERKKKHKIVELILSANKLKNKTRKKLKSYHLSVVIIHLGISVMVSFNVTPPHKTSTPINPVFTPSAPIPMLVFTSIFTFNFSLVN